ncbi:signal peptide containing protein [Theileria equi strain WA]|uniref:Signal peptide containing protein n=1 Tax=Theileria equi strain WA TaxID=1537102 RepID=L1LCQ1_THEEQ|nr:signal peptide containing protein [Theileria equi strain WA]EKX73025.1 signal peptide containing protein [Theileria equi strain WA]|eukprot:XP_004832477.1 signal peptide containing protein [Theileria equi strain WA]
MVLFRTTLPPLILLLIVLLQGANGTPVRNKIVITLDIAAEPRPYIKNLPSVEFPGGIYYTMKRGYISRYVFGDVFDGQEQIASADPSAMSRSILVAMKDDGSRYIRITDRYRRSQKICSRVKEFMRYPTDIQYIEIQRVPLEIDVLDVEHNHMVNKEPIINREANSRSVYNIMARMGIPVRVEYIPAKYTIQKNLQDEVVIGTVKFGEYTVDNKIEGLVNREVTWEGGMENPKIVITSRYINDTETRSEYKFLREIGLFDSLTRRKNLALFR